MEIFFNCLSRKSEQNGNPKIENGFLNDEQNDKPHLWKNGEKAFQRSKCVRTQRDGKDCSRRERYIHWQDPMEQ